MHMIVIIFENLVCVHLRHRDLIQTTVDETMTKFLVEDLLMKTKDVSFIIASDRENSIRTFIEKMNSRNMEVFTSKKDESTGLRDEHGEWAGITALTDLCKTVLLL